MEISLFTNFNDYFINPEFLIREFPLFYLLITYGFLVAFKIKNYDFRAVGVLLMLQLLPIFFLDVMLILFFNVDFEEILGQIVFIIIPYIIVMLIFFIYKNKKFKKKNMKTTNR